LGSGLDSSHVDTADTFSVNISNSDESRFTPAGTPGVLDNPVVLLSIVSVTNNQDTVVEVSSALSAVEDTTLISLEGTLVGFNSNGDWSVVDEAEELSSVVGGDISVTSSLGNLLFTSNLALTILSSVWVVIFRNETLILSSIVESGVHGATFASVATISGAINKLLLGEVGELLMSNKVSTFEGTSGGESPA